MENSTNPKNPKFIEDLQRASQEIEANLQGKRSVPQPEAKEEMKEEPRFPEKGFGGDLSAQAEEVAKERKRLEEIQRNLEKNQKQVTECIQELTTIQGEISRVLEGKKKIDEDLRQMREKNQKILEESGNPNSFWFSNK